MIRRVVDYALGHRLLTVLLVGLVTIWGIVAYTRLPKDIYPELNAPLVHIITEHPGMPAEDVERLITVPLESLLSGTPGVTRARSESTAGDSVITVEFDWGTDIYLARQIVSSKLQLIVGRLPVGTGTPMLGPVSSRMGEVFELAVVGSEGIDPMELRSIADWTVRYRLQGVPGVSFIINLGGFVRQYQVLLKPDMLTHYRISIREVREAIERSNRNFAGGVLTRDPQETLIKGLGQIETLADIEQTVITSRNNVPVFLRDVADVAVGPQFSRGSASHNGQEAVSITIEKQYGSDTLTTTENIRAALDRIARGLPSGVSLNAFYDQSRIILRAIRHVEVSLVEGAVLIVAVMLLFMGSLRGSLIASLTIPFSVAIALVIMELLGVDLTVMSIGGLAIGIGKVANGSIIMVENIHRVLRERRGQASILELTAAAAHEVAGPLVSASIIILLVFVPLLTLGDIEGAMFRPTALAVGAALLGALVLNLTLQPVLAATFLGDRPLIARTLGLTERLAVHYRRLLEGAIRRRRLVLGVCLGAVLLGAVAFSRLGKEFVPVLDEGAILVSTVMLPETSLAESTAMGQRIEKILMAFPEVVSVTRTTGSAEGTEHVHPVNHSHYHVELRPREQRNRGFEEITWAMREQLDALPGVAYIFEQPIANRMAEMLTGTEGQLAIKVFGTDIQMLGQTVEEVRAVLAQVPGVADLQVEQTAGIPQLEIRLDRERLARFGVAVADVAELVETALNGLEATEVFEKDRVTTVLVRLSESYRRNEESIRRLLVDTPGGQRIPLAELASIERTEGPQTIFREGLMRRKILVCNVAGRDLGGFVAEAREAIGRRVSLPPGTHITFGGQYESQTRALRHLSISLGLVALVIFVVLLTSFGRVLEPLVILLCVPVTLVGGIVGLVLAGETLNVSSTIGLIALFGIGIQNDLILVAKIAEIRRAGEPTCAAVIEGSLVKFRAILITNLVMIVGVLPLALGVTTGAELHRPLAVVYIGGFLFAILLKMVAVPALYATLAREEVPSPAPAG